MNNISTNIDNRCNISENTGIKLLPHLNELVLEWIDGNLIIRSLPVWFAQSIGIDVNDLLGKNVELVLEKFIPGIVDLANRVIFNKLVYSEVETFYVDKHGNKIKAVISGRYQENSDGLKFVIISFEELPLAIDRIYDSIDLEKATFCGLVGISKGMQRVFNKIRLYANSEAPVLIIGETGSGKEGVAKAIHLVSNRRNGPFVTVNCTAITDTLFESELFGHEKGSFTGAIKTHKGRFERADKGTLFLDEIGDLPLSSQAKLLRVLEEEKIERVGGEYPIKVDVRIVAATNKNLEEAVALNNFRADLYFRLNALQIRIPPLRERREDIPLLIKHFINILNKKYNRNVVGFTKDALAVLMQYQWPGNVRELRNLLERLFAENQTDIINYRALAEWIEERIAASKYANVRQDVTILPYKKAILLGSGDYVSKNNASYEMNNNHEVVSENSKRSYKNKPRVKLTPDILKKAFLESNGNITKAAEKLGIHKATFYRALKNLGLSRNDLQNI